MPSGAWTSGPALCALGSVRYFVGKSLTDGGEPSNLQPYGFQPVGQKRNMTIYENQYALPAGYTYTSYQTRSDYEKLSPLERQQAILQGVVVEDADAGRVSQVLSREEPRLTARTFPGRCARPRTRKSKTIRSG